MAALNGLTVHVTSKIPTITRGDGGTTVEWSLSGFVNTAATNRAAAQEIARQLRETFANWQYGVVHYDDDVDNEFDGLYLFLSGQVPGVHTSTRAMPFTVTLRRLGGGGLHGNNLVRRVRVAASLQTNDFSVTSIPIFALPVDAVGLTIANPGIRDTANGNSVMRSSASGETYVMSVADINKGECKVWDTAGDATEANWKRVWAVDHTFANPGHIVVDNGLVRFKGKTSGNLGELDVEVWNGTAWAAAVTGGTTHLLVAGNGFASAPNAVRIEELSHWRVSVRWDVPLPASPSLANYILTLDRGRCLAKIVLTPVSSAALRIGIEGGQYVVNGGTVAFDDGVETGDISLTASTDAWLAAWNGSSATGVMAVAGIASNAATPTAREGGGFYFSRTATSLTAYLGGVLADLSTARGEAENGTLGGTASIVTVSGASGGGTNNAVSLPSSANPDQVQFNALAITPAAGARVMVWARVQNVGVSASDSVRVLIWDNTTSAEVAGTNYDFATLGTSGTWKWATTTLASSAASASLRPRVYRQAHAGGGTLYCDEVYFLIVDSSGGITPYPRTVGREALTEVRTWDETVRNVQ